MKTTKERIVVFYAVPMFNIATHRWQIYPHFWSSKRHALAHLRSMGATKQPVHRFRMPLPPKKRVKK